MFERDKHYSHIQDYGNRICIIGNPTKEIKNAFYFTLLGKIIKINSQEQNQDSNEYTHCLACNNLTISHTNKEKIIENPQIFVYKDHFIIDNQDYSHLMPITIRHEIAESWLYAKTGFSLSPKPKIVGEKRVEIGHAIALKEEWNYAVKIGKSDEYMEFIKKFISKNIPEKYQQEAILENEEAKKYAENKITNKRLNLE